MIYKASKGLRWGCSPQTPTRVLSTLDPQLRMLLDELRKRCSRCFFDVIEVKRIYISVAFGHGG